MFELRVESYRLKRRSAAGIDERELQRIEIDLAVIAVARRAGLVLGVADAATARTHNVKERILLAVDIRLKKIKRLAARLTLEPELIAGGGPKDQLPLREALLHRELVGVRDKDNLLGVGVLDSYRNNPGIVLKGRETRIRYLLADLLELGEVKC